MYSHTWQCLGSHPFQRYIHPYLCKRTDSWTILCTPFILFRTENVLFVLCELFWKLKRDRLTVQKQRVRRWSLESRSQFLNETSCQDTHVGSCSFISYTSCPLGISFTDTKTPDMGSLTTPSSTAALTSETLAACLRPEDDWGMPGRPESVDTVQETEA